MPITMKIPIKYGLLIALGAMAWVLITHALVTNPESALLTLGPPIVFNILQFTMIFLGLRELERTKGDSPTFKEGLKTGVLISLVYGVTIALFFVGVLAVIGTKWLASEPGAASLPMSQLALRAFAGLLGSAMLLGVIYSTVISFFLAKRRSEEN